MRGRKKRLRGKRWASLRSAITYIADIVDAEPMKHNTSDIDNAKTFIFPHIRHEKLTFPYKYTLTHQAFFGDTAL